MDGRRADRRRRGRVVLGALAVSLLLGVGLALAVSLLLGLAAFTTVLLVGLVAPVVHEMDWRGFRAWWRLQTQPVGKGTAVASLNAVWPPVRRTLRPDFVWANYPGVEAHKRAYFPPWVERLLRPVFPTGFMRFDRHWGMILSSLASAEALDESPVTMERLLRELRKQFPNQPPIALAGRLPSIAANFGLTLGPPFTTGDRGTVCSMVGAAREAARLLGKEPDDATLGVVGSKGFIGSRLVTSLSGEFAHIVALDSRYDGRSQGEEGVLYTDRPEDLGDAEAILVFTPKGADMSSVASHVSPGAVVADDSHPEMPTSLRAQMERRGVIVMKATLRDDRIRFVPQIPDFRHDDIPACLVEALVVVERGSEILESQEGFNRAAEELGFRARLAPHLNATQPFASVESTDEQGDHAALARLPRGERVAHQEALPANGWVPSEASPGTTTP